MTTIARHRLGAVACLAACLLCACGGSSSSGREGARRSAASSGSLVFIAEPFDRRPALPRALASSLAILRLRLRSAGLRATVTAAGDRVTIHGVSASVRARVLSLAQPGQLRFYDWEADALTSRGRAVAGRIADQDPAALEISQGLGNSPPGMPGTGGLALYDAVRLASRRRPVRARFGLSRLGPAYYLFGAPGGSACVAAARSRGARPVPGDHCLLAGPASRARDLGASLPPGVTVSAGRRLAVAQGTVVLQASDSPPGQQVGPSSPAAQFFVLRDRESLDGSEVVDPHPGTNAGGQLDVAFAFTPAGARAFHAVTAVEARRGSAASLPGQELQQHFAVALDSRLITVPAIDFRLYPDGIASAGADITGGLTTRSARDLSLVLRSHPLSVQLVPAHTG